MVQKQGKKMTSRCAVSSVAVTLLAIAAPCGATEYAKETTLAQIIAQGERPLQGSSQDLDFIKFTPGATWSVHGGSGAGVCSEAGAVLPTGNAMMRAMALAAIASGATVQVVVDNSFPLVDGWCQITLLAIKAG
jgi:hypothetical protein